MRDALIEVVFHLSNATDIDAVANGISKVNISSDYKHAFFAKVREILAENDGWDPNTLFPEAIEAGKKVVHHKNELFNAVGKAALYEGIDPWRAEFI
ncbi:fructose-bisphosphate aldolase [Ligilactobacillus saerimneri 30a]|uniref:Fructose-bisphosphate aldolase n=1 Tax=Ligilactobacillus saerimneri 30a TaxID=1227363 RepID=M5J7J4_9LACO|nr:fructose-bisphosphate aldolase [Ligilactobacillus saerimneri 30a]